MSARQIRASAIRFDGRRAAMSSGLDDAPARVRAQLMLLEHEVARTAALR